MPTAVPITPAIDCATNITDYVEATITFTLPETVSIESEKYHAEVASDQMQYFQLTVNAHEKWRSYFYSKGCFLARIYIDH